ncbi:MAG: WD40 repeat domain-containing protein [Planctomycetaceae bacterium]|nr:WD40 repeat domain-containing protein [Planctomycetaceae bacterium]
MPEQRPVIETSIRQLQIAEDGRTVWVTRLPSRLQNVDLATGRVLIDLPVPECQSPAPLGMNASRHMVFLNHSGQPMVQRIGYEEEPVALHRVRDAKIGRIAVNPRDNVVVLATNHALELCSWSHPDRRHAIVAQDRRCGALAWSPDGTQLLVVDQDGWLSLRDGRTLAELARTATHIEFGIRAAWSQNGRFALAYGSNGPIAVWDTHTPAAGPRHLEFELRFTAALSPDGRQIAICDPERQVWLININDPGDRICLDHVPTLANAICYTPDGGRLLVGTLNGELLCWSLVEERWLWTLGG